MAWSPDRALVAIAFRPRDEDKCGVVRLWDALMMRAVEPPSASGAGATSAAVLLDDKQFAAALA